MRQRCFDIGGFAVVTSASGAESLGTSPPRVFNIGRSGSSAPSIPPTSFTPARHPPAHIRPPACVNRRRERDTRLLSFFFGRTAGNFLKKKHKKLPYAKKKRAATPPKPIFDKTLKNFDFWFCCFGVVSGLSPCDNLENKKQISTFKAK